MSLIYRRTHGSEIWHFRWDCAQWPLAGFEQATQTPAGGLCCMECTYWPASTASRKMMGPDQYPPPSLA